MSPRRTLVLPTICLLTLLTTCLRASPSPPPDPDSDPPSYDPSVTIPELKTQNPADYVCQHFRADGMTALLGLPNYVQIVGQRANVVASVPGMGPHAGEYVIVGAHDKSGAAVVLALAHLAEQQAPRPRTIVFCVFCMEKDDFVGSRFFVEHPPLLLTDVVAMIDVDGIDRLTNNTIYIGGQDTAKDFDAIVQHATSGWPLKEQPAPPKLGGRGAIGPGDQKAFVLKHIPVLLVSGGIAADAGEINYPGVEQVIALGDRLIDGLASMPADQEQTVRPAIPTPPPAPIAKADPVISTQPVAPPPRPVVILRPRLPAGPLGVIPDDEVGNIGVLVDGIRPGSPADQAGLQAGDLIVQFGDKSIMNLSDVVRCMAGAKAGDRVILVVRRGDQVLRLHATLRQRQ
ncbi:MAG TPA: PDZ domain-containing protein [Tepidisphaeraceae bacterium]|nr:PDZ domain-containing protein [Tepidisphaeraceae bacterium]